ncbi:hypothetical protein HID58_015353 [Brassica napus]|uniref:Transposase n=1 Tax=Brassica napus TaxID=3708 RepID=A0ABQ8DJS1_BRANA|nr:hypothetical protein HID58_015353 [Brassica napus]
MKDCPFYLKTVRFGYGRHGIYNQLSYSFPTDCKARTFDWRFDKRTQKLHDRKSRYMPVNIGEATVEKICGQISVGRNIGTTRVLRSGCKINFLRRRRQRLASLEKNRKKLAPAPNKPDTFLIAPGVSVLAGTLSAAEIASVINKYGSPRPRMER